MTINMDECVARCRPGVNLGTLCAIHMTFVRTDLPVYKVELDIPISISQWRNRQSYVLESTRPGTFSHNANRAETGIWSTVQVVNGARPRSGGLSRAGLAPMLPAVLKSIRSPVAPMECPSDFMNTRQCLCDIVALDRYDHQIRFFLKWHQDTQDRKDSRLMQPLPMMQNRFKPMHGYISQS